jgi:hypothetical protein
MKNFQVFLISVLMIISGSASFGQNQRIAGLVNQVEMDNMVEHISKLCDAGGHKSRVTYTAGNYAAAEYIASYFETLSGITSVERDTFYLSTATPPYNEFPLINIVATMEAKSENPNTIIIGAHYDASGSRGANYEGNWETVKAQGADDNATGVASIMEIAKVLSEPLNQFNNQHNIIFVAYAAEEYHPMHPDNHHAGSIWDAYNRKNKLEPVEHVIVLDMIGFNEEKNYVEIICNDQSLNLANSVYHFNSLYTPELETNSAPFPDVPYSDHESYQDYGFPAILLMENERPWNNEPPNYLRNPHYHTFSDTIGTLNFEQVQLVAKLALASIAELTYADPTSVDDPSVDGLLPSDFSIAAYPNPFNPDATIKYNIPAAALSEVEVQKTTLRIYDILGNEVATLVDEQKSSGTHYIAFNADGLSSGVYFAVLSNNNQIITQKLMLMK